MGPSKLNGRVTIHTVNIPSSLQIFATTGAAPVPVPPPIPAVTNTRSDPATIDETASLSCIIAFLPISGFAPAPNPFVKSFPI